MVLQHGCCLLSWSNDHDIMLTDDELPEGSHTAKLTLCLDQYLKARILRDNREIRLKPHLHYGWQRADLCISMMFNMTACTTIYDRWLSSFSYRISKMGDFRRVMRESAHLVLDREIHPLRGLDSVLRFDTSSWHHDSDVLISHIGFQPLISYMMNLVFCKTFPRSPSPKERSKILLIVSDFQRSTPSPSQRVALSKRLSLTNNNFLENFLSYL